MQKGLMMSDETKKRISNSLKGKSKGCLGYKHTKEAIKKISESHKGKGHKQSQETRKKISNKLKGIQPKYNVSGWNKGLKGIWTGELNCNWKGGTTTENSRIRTSLEYKLWRDSVFARDGYTCQKYLTHGGDLQAHHILNFSSHKELALAIDNGITLSKKAHKEFHKIYGNKNNTLEQIIEFIKH